METQRRHGPYEERLARSLAFLGRYAHQSLRDVMGLTVERYQRLIIATGKLLEDEALAAQQAARRP